MKANVGSYDAALRFVVGVGLLALANHGHVWAWIGLVPVATAALGFCPFSWAIGRNTAAQEHCSEPSLGEADEDSEKSR